MRGADLAPTLAQLLAPRPDLLPLLALLLAGAGYLWLWSGRAQGDGRGRWPLWRGACFLLAWLLGLLLTQTRLADFTLSSMALYMGRLMVLAELIPPFALLGLAPARLPLSRARLPGRLLSWLLDPWVALALWTTIIIFWNIPAGFNASLVSNTASGLLPVLYLLGGLLTWAVVLRPFPGLQGGGYGNRGWFGLLASLPMMGVAAVWLYSPTVLYAPYVGALCLWNTTPLQNQVASGYVMMAAGLPGMGLALVQLTAWLIALADSGTVEEETGSGE